MTFTIPYPKDKKAKSTFCREYGLNAIYAGKHWARRKADRDYWHLLVQAELRRQGVPVKVFEKPVEIRFYWNDGLDCSNHAYMGKMIEDSLKGWVLTDDSHRYVQKITHTLHSLPCITVEIREV